MATEKPRFTITVDEDLLKRIDDYRFDNRISNRTQAVIQLIEQALDRIESSEQEAKQQNK